MKKEYMIIVALIVCLFTIIIMGSIQDNSKKEKIDNNNTNEYTEKDKNKMVYIYKFDEYPDINIPYIDLNTNSKEIMEINNRIKEVMLSGSAQYKYYINNDILTLLITNDDRIIGTYNINVKTKEFMTFKDICDYMNIDFRDMKKYLSYKIKEQKGNELPHIPSGSYMVNILDYNKDYYIDENNKINVILNNENILIDDISVPGDEDQTTLDFIIENELYLLGGKKSISEITNKEKVWYAHELSGGFTNGMLESGKVLRDAFSYSSLSNLGVEMDDIIFNGNFDLRCYQYIKTTDMFIDTASCHKGIHFTYVNYLKTSDYVKEGNKYTISAKFLWNWADESSSVALFGSYKDAQNAQNPVYKIPEGKTTFTYDEMNKIIESNSIETYNFTFEKQNNNFKLIDFYVTR